MTYFTPFSSVSILDFEQVNVNNQNVRLIHFRSIVNCPFFIPLLRSENLRLSDTIRGYRMRILTWNESLYVMHSKSTRQT